jgi:hypothetical protein
MITGVTTEPSGITEPMALPHLLVDISAHGYGHLGQTAPVLNALAEAVGDLEITVRSGLPGKRLARVIAVPFRHVHQATDFGYVMRNAVDLDLPATAERYREFHETWHVRVSGEAAWLSANRFDAVLTNISYLPLAGAARAGIPAVAMCSLNWADLFQHNFGGAAWAIPIYEEMLAAYAGARTFLRVTPGLPMTGLANVRVVGPVCRMRTANRTATAAKFGIEPGGLWLLIAMGGISFPLDLASWPERDGLRYLVPPELSQSRPDVTTVHDDAVDFTELLSCVDIVATKPGYGTFVEAACHGRPVLFVPRGDDWPEAAFLTDWLRRNGRAQEVERSRFVDGDFMSALESLVAQPVGPAPSPGGTMDAVRAIASLLKPGLL